MTGPTSTSCSSAPTWPCTSPRPSTPAWCATTPRKTTTTRRTSALIADLRHAIDAGELVLHYQPKAALTDGRVDAVEALVRWQHPTLGLLYPDRFIPLCEQTDLIDRLTDLGHAPTALTDVRDLGWTWRSR